MRNIYANSVKSNCTAAKSMISCFCRVDGIDAGIIAVSNLVKCQEENKKDFLEEG